MIRRVGLCAPVLSILVTGSRSQGHTSKSLQPRKLAKQASHIRWPHGYSAFPGG